MGIRIAKKAPIFHCKIRMYGVTVVCITFNVKFPGSKQILKLMH